MNSKGTGAGHDTINRHARLGACRSERIAVGIKVLIFRMDARSDWMLWLVGETGRPIVWDQVFDSEAEAYSEFEKFMREEAMSALDKGYSDGSNVIPFRRR